MGQFDQLVHSLIDDLIPWVADRLGTGLRARVYNSAAITLTTGVAAALTFNSETYDTSSIHDTGANTSRLTAPRTANYHIWGNVEFASNATGLREIYILRNGTDALAVHLEAAVNGAVTVLPICTDFQLTAGDYVELWALQNSGGNLNVQASNFYSPYFGMSIIP
jgi:hypothetical protein